MGAYFTVQAPDKKADWRVEAKRVKAPRATYGTRTLTSLIFRIETQLQKLRVASAQPQIRVKNAKHLDTQID